MTDSTSSESGAQLLARLEGKRCLKDIEPRLFPEDSSPVQGDVVEFFGAEGTGKTETLYHVVARCILPAECGGLEAEVMFIDTDYHLDMLRLVCVLERRLARVSEETVRTCLRRLLVAHCSSSVQLLLTLRGAEATLCSRPALGLLIVDSISAFYWADRSSGGDSVAWQESGLRQCAELIGKLLQEQHIVVFATTHAIMQKGPAPGAADEAAEGVAEASSSSQKLLSTAHGELGRTYLCRSWQRIVTHRVFFSKADTTKDKKQVFTALSSCTRTSGTKRSTFCVGDGGVEFH